LRRPSPGDASFALPAAEPAKGYRGGSVPWIDNALVVRWWENGKFSRAGSRRESIKETASRRWCVEAFELA